MGAMASQITSLTVVYSTVYSDADQINIEAPRHWPFVRGISPHKWPETRKMFPFDDVIMISTHMGMIKMSIILPKTIIDAFLLIYFESQFIYYKFKWFDANQINYRSRNGLMPNLRPWTNDYSIIQHGLTFS